jgi:cyclase
MLKKRIIFTLLYDDGSFVLSRNFRLQRVGDLGWLQKHYNFQNVALYIDELVVLDVTRGNRNLDKFCETLRTLTKDCFVPIAAGGGVNSVSAAKRLLNSGADKVVANTALIEAPSLLTELASVFGQQCIVGSIDVKQVEGAFRVFTENGSRMCEGSPEEALAKIPRDAVGELYMNSIDRDGTGQGYDFRILELLPSDWTTPVILAGGVGNSGHIIEGFRDSRVDATATAHLFNFVGDGLRKAREAVRREGYQLAVWPSNLTEFNHNETANKSGS